MSNVIPAEAGTQARIVLMPAFAKRIHSDVLEEQQRSAVRLALFTLFAPLPLTPTPLPVGEGLKAPSFQRKLESILIFTGYARSERQRSAVGTHPCSASFFRFANPRSKSLPTMRSMLNTNDITLPM